MKELKHARELNDDELEDVTGGLIFGAFDLKKLFQKNLNPLNEARPDPGYSPMISVQTDDHRNA